MIIDSMELQDYRNYESLRIQFCPGTNILYGNNAQGKTNILEAIYLCSTAKSHRGSKDRDMIRFGTEEAHIKTIIKKNEVPCRIDMHLKKNKAKGIAVNGMPIRRASELFGIVNVVVFSPEDLNLIKNGPSERRKFIDMELCQLNPLYVHALASYNRSLIQRNRLLKELPFHPEYADTLDAWDIQLVRYGKDIIRYRSEFIIRLNERIHDIHWKLSGEKEELSIVYDPNCSADRLEEAVLLSRDSDQKQKTSLVGPHRDDIGFYIGRVDIRKFGSQGQQRTAALSLKLSEIELVKILVKDYPVLLLDDVLSELDENRQKHLLAAINHIQTVITCTGIEDFRKHLFPMDRVFQVVQGKIERE